MKICPKCNNTYSDASLNFCLNDGTPLSPANESQPTVLVTPPRPTAGNQPFGTQPQQPNWGLPNQSARPVQPKKSRAWLWVLGIVGGVILLCGGGLAALIAIAPSLDDSGNLANSGNSGNFAKNDKNTKNDNDNSAKKSSTVLKDDLSGWKPDNEILGKTKYSGNQLTMSSDAEGYYYVLITPKTNFRTENATTKIIVKNTTADTTSLGFGLVIHSDQKEPLKRDYAFLIDSESKRYRVVRHKDKNEETVIEWTRSTEIKDGTQENVLEVRDEKGKMSFFINGQLVNDYTDSDGIQNGFPGLYVSDAVPISFSDLQIKK